MATTTMYEFCLKSRIFRTLPTTSTTKVFWAIYPKNTKRGIISGKRGIISGKRGTISAKRGTISAKRGTVSGKRGTISSNVGPFQANVGPFHQTRDHFHTRFHPCFTTDTKNVSIKDLTFPLMRLMIAT